MHLAPVEAHAENARLERELRTLRAVAAVTKNVPGRGRRGPGWAPSPLGPEICQVDRPGEGEWRLICNHSVFLILRFWGLDQETATKWPYNWSPELILGAFCIILGA